MYSNFQITFRIPSNFQKTVTTFKKPLSFRLGQSWQEKGCALVPHQDARHVACQVSNSCHLERSEQSALQGTTFIMIIILTNGLIRKQFVLDMWWVKALMVEKQEGEQWSHDSYMRKAACVAIRISCNFVSVVFYSSFTFCVINVFICGPFYVRWDGTRLE